MFKNMKISFKLALGFTIALLGMVVCVIVGFISLNTLSSSMDILVNDRIPKTVWANNIIDAINDNARAVRNILLTDDPREVELNFKRFEENKETVNEFMKKLEETIKSSEGKKLLENLHNVRQNKYFPVREKLMNLYNEGKHDEAKILLFGDMRTAQNEYLNAAKKLIDFQNKIVETEGKEANDIAHSSIMILIIVAACIFVLCLLIAVLITRAIKKPLAKAVEAAKAISKGNMKVDLETNSKDETGILLVSMQTMAKTVTELVDDARYLSSAAIAGKLDVRADSSKYEGDFNALINGINGTLDAVIGPLNVAAEYVDRISKGDIPPRITDNYNGDFNEIKNNLNVCIDTINSLVYDANMLSKAAVQGKLDTRADAAKHQGDFRAIVEGVNNTLDAVIGPLNVAAEYVDRISKGDIPPRITDNYNGDFNEIKNNLNVCIDTINSLVHDANMLSKAAVQGKLDTRADAAKHQGDFRAIVEGVNNTLDAVIGPLNVAAEYVDRISKGEIPPKITDNYNGDFNEIKNNLNQCIDGLGGLVESSRILKMLVVNDLTEKIEGNYLGIYAEIANSVNLLHLKLKEITRTCNDVAAGKLDDLEVIRKEGKRSANDTLNPAFLAMMEALQNLVNETVILADAGANGRLDTRGDTTKYQGEFRRVVEGMNRTLDAVIGPLNVAAEYVDRISKGDIPPKITDSYNGDFNEIKNNLNTCIDAINKLIDDTIMLGNAASEGDLKTRADASKHQGQFRAIVEGINTAFDNFINPMEDSFRALEVMSQGDMTARMTGDYKGEFYNLKNYINTLAESLSNLLRQVIEAVQTSASSSIEISSTAETMAASAEEQSAQADEVASAVEEMTRTITENAMSANKTAHSAEKNRDIAIEGGQVVEQTVGKMRDIATVVKLSAENIEKLGESSKQIGEIISVIDDIADQTNLLALNAAIEAARAGEQGRGFAVVADEVRKLAERTTEATKQIATMIKGIQNETQQAVIAMKKGNDEVTNGISLADRAGNALKVIVDSSQDVLDMIAQIATATEEQSSTSEEIAKNVTSISSVTAESAKRIQEIARSSDDLAKLNEHLREVMLQFHIDDSALDYDMLAAGKSMNMLGSQKKRLPGH